MKVSELIKQLQELPKDVEIKIEVFYYDPDIWWYSEYEEPSIVDQEWFYAISY